MTKAQKVSPKVAGKVKDRSEGVCEICGVRPGVQIHHRTGRQKGGSRDPWVNLPGNLLHVCLESHDMVTDTRGNRPEYERKGWLVRRGIKLPVEIPVYIHAGSWGPAWVFLTDDGHYIHLSADEVIERGLTVEDAA